MANTKRPVIPMQNPRERVNNFSEVVENLSDEMAKNEAKRCLNCKTKPCVAGCPIAIDIPRFIGKIASGDNLGAYRAIKEYSSLPAVCGRVCPQEKQCEKNCVQGIKSDPIAIGALERYVADKYIFENFAPKASSCQPDRLLKVAIAGSGPAGLTCAGNLANLGYNVTVFEALHALGGVLSYGIPEFRLPKAIVEKEIDNLKRAGVKFETNVVIGKTFSIKDLFSQGFSAIFLGTGAGVPRFMGIQGENLQGVYSANEFLTRVNLMKAYKDDYDTPIKDLGKVIVVGGGNVAMDTARVAVRLGAKETTLVYRRSEEELPARREEIEHAKEEGVKFKFLSNPKKILPNKNGRVCTLLCAKMQLSDIDNYGRRKVVEKKDEVFYMDADTVIMAIGTLPNPILKASEAKLKFSDTGQVIVDQETLMTSIDGVFAGGDIVSGAATVLLAMSAGKRAAKAIDKYLKQHRCAICK
ncbi:MAG: NADPH-dependent glutamate synthase [Clostridia bacterium]|nr:NADPH-dependent glutamate synthase [Clostridia bacterium]